MSKLGWGFIAETAVRMFFVVLMAPELDEGFRFKQVAEYLAVQEFIPEPGVEAFDVRVLPGRSRFNVARLGPESGKFIAEGLGNELRSVIGTNERRGTVDAHQASDLSDGIDSPDRAPNQDAMAFPGELIDHRHGLQGPAILGDIEYEVVAPDVSSELCRQMPGTGITQVEIPLLPLPLRHLKAVQTPETFNPRSGHRPTGPLKQGGYPTVAKARLFSGRLLHGMDKTFIPVRKRDLVALRGPRLPQDSTSPPFTDAQHILHMLDSQTATRRA